MFPKGKDSKKQPQGKSPLRLYPKRIAASCETAITLVRVTGFEPTASWSRTKRATSCATPGFNAILLYRPQNSLSRETKGGSEKY